MGTIILNVLKFLMNGKGRFQSEIPEMLFSENVKRDHIITDF